MDGAVDFDINEALKLYLSDPKTIATPEADSALVECESDPEALTSELVSHILSSIVDAVAESPDAIARGGAFDSLQFLLKSASLLPGQALGKILDLVVSGLSGEVDVVHNDFEADDQDAARQHQRLLEMYGFLLQWSIAAVEAKATEPSSDAPVARGRGASKSAKARGGRKESTWDPSSQLQTALECMCKVLKLNLSTIFTTTPDKNTFISLLTRPIYLLLENEQRVKSTSLRMHAFKVLCIAIKHHGHGFGAQTSIMQSLSYFDHLSEPMAELLQILAEQYDYPQLADEILREMSNKEFNSNDTKGPKSISTFITRLSELAPRLVMKQMTILVKQLDSESYTLRCALIEVCGNLIADLSKQDERGDNHLSQINSFFDVLEERFLDVNPYCRCRAMQVFIKLCDLEAKFPKRRQAVAELVVKRLEDKSSNVRKNAIKLLSKLVTSHPFSAMHGGQLSYAEWTARLNAVQTELNQLEASTGALHAVAGEGDSREATVDEDLLDDATDIGNQPQAATQQQNQEASAVANAGVDPATSETLARLQLTQRYYQEAIRFIEVLHQASPLICQLLQSKNKSEVIEAMDYFVIIDAYKVETARAGIRRMLRLVWTKGNSDEGKGVQTHLIECYKGLFFEAPDTFSANDAANYVARSMISLTFGATPAELTSLEQLLCSMMKAGHISELVLSKLWQVYGVRKKEISKNQRRGAIIVLGMLALADPQIVAKELETVVRIGLGGIGRADLVLAKYSCIALARLNTSKRQGKDLRLSESAPSLARLPNDHVVLVQLAALLGMQSDSKEWYSAAEQAIGAIYALSKHPDVLCSEVLRRKTKDVFGQQTQATAEDSVMGEGDLLTPPPENGRQEKQKSTVALSQLLFIVGHIAIKQIVHLEYCELEFKRIKAEKEKSNHGRAGQADKTAVEASTAPGAPAPADELDLIGGTSEDDFTEAMAHIRERELLYGAHSLLANFGPLVTELCAHNTAYADAELQAAAALCLAKLMCVSAEFCEANLPLLITILERSADHVIRSNVVIALGDMAVCFNHLVDENTGFLYRRLGDADASVKRTCLMTLTFLILAGQVKVKGQLGEMAKCLEDSDRRIADLAKMFFTELATKDNAIYNHFVDMFSLLSADAHLEEDALRRIIKFLASFVEKDKYAKQLAEKLAARLARCNTEREWNDVAYAISLLPHKNEEIQKTVSAGFRVVQANA